MCIRLVPIQFQNKTWKILFRVAYRLFTLIFLFFVGVKVCVHKCFTFVYINCPNVITCTSLLYTLRLWQLRFVNLSLITIDRSIYVLRSRCLKDMLKLYLRTLWDYYMFCLLAEINNYYYPSIYLSLLYNNIRCSHSNLHKIVLTKSTWDHITEVAQILSLVCRSTLQYTRDTSQAAQSRCTVVRPIQKSIRKWEIRPPVKS